MYVQLLACKRTFSDKTEITSVMRTVLIWVTEQLVPLLAA